MNPMQCETVKVVREGSRKGYHIKNKSDLAEGDVIFGEKPADDGGSDISKLKVDELKARLEELKVEIHGDAKKPQLIQLLEEAEAKAQGEGE